MSRKNYLQFNLKNTVQNIFFEATHLYNSHNIKLRLKVHNDYVYIGLLSIGFCHQVNESENSLCVQYSVTHHHIPSQIVGSSQSKRDENNEICAKN